MYKLHIDIWLGFPTKVIVETMDFNIFNLNHQKDPKSWVNLPSQKKTDSPVCPVWSHLPRSGRGGLTMQNSCSSQLKISRNTPVEKFHGWKPKIIQLEKKILLSNLQWLWQNLPFSRWIIVAYIERILKQLHLGNGNMDVTPSCFLCDCDCLKIATSHFGPWIPLEYSRILFLDSRYLYYSVIYTGIRDIPCQTELMPNDTLDGPSSASHYIFAAANSDEQYFCQTIAIYC